MRRFGVKPYEFVTTFIISIASRLIHKYNIYLNLTFGKADWPRVPQWGQPRIRSSIFHISHSQYFSTIFINR